MSLLWYWRYIPCAGVKLEFDEFDLYEKDERTIVHLTRRDPKQRRKIFQKHIQEDGDRLFKHVEKIDFEIALASISGDGIFLLDYAHVFTFLLMIRTGGWISAPVSVAPTGGQHLADILRPLGQELPVQLVAFTNKIEQINAPRGIDLIIEHVG
jgi:hypothetical protein